MSRAALMALVNAGVTGRWGETVVFRPGLGTEETIQAIYDAAHVTEQLQDGVPISTLRPVVDYTVADVTVQPVQGDTVTAGGIAYKVADVQADNGGMVKLLLLRA